MDSKIQIVKTQTLAQDVFDEIPVLASNGVPDIECVSCLADMIEVEKKKIRTVELAQEALPEL